MLSDDDKNNIKIFKYLTHRKEDISSAILESDKLLEENIRSAEELVRKLDRPLPIDSIGQQPFTRTEQLPRPDLETYEQILAQANNHLGENSAFSFSDILSSEEINLAYGRIDEINREFSIKTGLQGYDLSFIAIATALQTIKWICLPEIGHSFDPNERKKHDDAEIEAEHKASLNKYKDQHYSNSSDSTASYWEPKKNEQHKKSWMEILFTKAPYDKIKGSAALDLNLSGTNHRLKTLGHDPILGWVFGTMNFMTDTATLADFRSFRIRDSQWQDEPVFIGQVFQESVDLTLYDKHCLAAALVAQGAHLASDSFTKMGLPIPFLSTLSPDFASKLYSEHYDSLCFARDCKVVAISAVISSLINMIISFTHGMFYEARRNGVTRDLYEVRTRKILLISNTIATSSNLLYCGISKNIHKLDIGGTIVTIMRLFSDVKFISSIKEEFVQSKIDNDLNDQLAELDDIFKKHFYIDDKYS